MDCDLGFGKKDFSVAQVFDFASQKAGVPLEIYVTSKDGKPDQLHVTTAKPGHIHMFDISKDVGKPQHIKTLATAEGAHHVAYTKDGKLAFVQNSFLNLPGMNDGSIPVLDLAKGEVVASIDTLKEQGLAPNCIVLLPQWNEMAGHSPLVRTPNRESAPPLPKGYRCRLRRRADHCPSHRSAYLEPRGRRRSPRASKPLPRTSS